MEVSQEHVSAGCNRVMGPLDWGDTDVVAYGAHNLVILYDAEVIATGFATMTKRAMCVSHLRTCCGLPHIPTLDQLSMTPASISAFLRSPMQIVAISPTLVTHHVNCRQQRWWPPWWVIKTG